MRAAAERPALRSTNTREPSFEASSDNHVVRLLFVLTNVDPRDAQGELRAVVEARTAELSKRGDQNVRRGEDDHETRGLDRQPAEAALAAAVIAAGEEHECNCDRRGQ